MTNASGTKDTEEDEGRKKGKKKSRSIFFFQVSKFREIFFSGTHDALGGEGYHPTAGGGVGREVR